MAITVTPSVVTVFNQTIAVEVEVEASVGYVAQQLIAPVHITIVMENPANGVG